METVYVNPSPKKRRKPAAKKRATPKRRAAPKRKNPSPKRRPAAKRAAPKRKAPAKRRAPAARKTTRRRRPRRKNPAKQAIGIAKEMAIGGLGAMGGILLMKYGRPVLAGTLQDAGLKLGIAEGIIGIAAGAAAAMVHPALGIGLGGSILADGGETVINALQASKEPAQTSAVRRQLPAAMGRVYPMTRVQLRGVR